MQTKLVVVGWVEQCETHQKIMNLNQMGFGSASTHPTLLEYLPPYSPDLNSIEHKWAQAKVIRKQKICSVVIFLSFL